MMKPSCSFSWWCSGMTRSGSRSTTAIVIRSPLTARAVMPSRSTYGLSSPSARMVLLNFAIDDRGRSQSPAAAHRLQAVAPVAPLQLVQQARHQARPRGAQRMAHRDRAAVDVGLLQVGARLLLPGEYHRLERLVDLRQFDASQLEAGPLQSSGRSRARPPEHENRA